MDVRSALKQGMSQLRVARVPSHTLAAELLLMHALGRDRTWLYSHPEETIEPTAAEQYLSLVTRRAAGEPTQYLTGKQEFWGLEFEVNSSVLIPRPETEHVVEVALERLGPRGLKIHLRTGAATAPLRIADVGTGSGCIAVALARELPHATIVATDISAPALDVARRNAARHDVQNQIEFVEADLLGSFFHQSEISTHESSSSLQESLPKLRDTSNESRAFDLIVSNPPYVARDEADTLPREVREHEPHAALFGGADGTEIYARLIHQAHALFNSGGILVLELGHNSDKRVRQMLTAEGGWDRVCVTNDLAGIPRVIAAARA